MIAPTGPCRLRLVTLWEMFSNWAYRFDNALTSLRAVRDHRLIIEPESKVWLEAVGRSVLQISADLGLHAAERRTSLFLRDMNSLVQRRDQDGIAQAVDEIERLLQADMVEVCFESIPLSRTDYYNAGFGAEVADAFPSAMDDIREGNTCFALSRYTACVFHMMRAAEVALRVLAWDRRTLTKQDAKVTEWNTLIESLSTVIDEMGKLPRATWRSPQIRDTQLRFYHEAMLEFRSFNVVYRRHVSHARDNGHYDEGQTQSVREHTEAFLRILARKISEARRTNVTWRSA